VSSLRELYASRIGHYDAGNLRGSTLFLPTPASYSNSWDAFITLYMESLTAEEREIIKAGSLINFNKNRQM
ncbi:hypothetical protein, partial [Escherichia coli]|uniref:hypothetical protein n=1 Tax=Escherichia coli TaxID=562 RepID=UPI001C407EFC